VSSPTMISVSSPADLKRLSDAGFKQPHDPIRLIVCSEGLEKSGKSEWATKMGHGLIAHIGIDANAAAAAERARRNGRQILLLDKFRLPPSHERPRDIAQVKTMGEKLYAGVFDAISMCVDNHSVGNVIIDTFDQLWELIRLKMFGKLDKVKGHHYTDANQLMKGIIQMFQARENLNVVMINKQKKQYVAKSGTGDDDAPSGNWNGKYEMTGFQETKYLANAAIEHSFNSETVVDREGKHIYNSFGYRILRCSNNMQDLANMEYWGEENEPWTLGMGMFPDTDPEFWGFRP